METYHDNNQDAINSESLKELENVQIDTIERITSRWENRKHHELDVLDLFDMLSSENSQAPLLRKLYAEGCEYLHNWMVVLWHEGKPPQLNFGLGRRSGWSAFASKLSKEWKSHEERNWYLEKAELFKSFKAEMQHKWRKALQRERMRLWSPTKYLLATTARSALNVESLSAIVFDMDDGQTPMEEVVAFWEGKGINVLCHESFGSTEKHPKYRVILPLLKRVPVNLWKPLWLKVSAMTPGNPDEACKDASRLYYVNYGTFSGPGKVLSSNWDTPWVLDWRKMDLKPPPKLHPKWKQIAAPKRNPLYQDEIDYTDPKERLALAERLGARISSTRAYHVECPQCGDNSVWFYLEAGAKSSAGCNHKKTCNWNGGLWRLDK
tara:strand:+ start:410 stop:1546 length:1137 start_codon:yes stop_codon:yes gene_type:complete